MSSSELPKVELHCHMDGLLDPSMAREIRAEDPGFPVDPEELGQAYPVDSFDRFMRWWEFVDVVEGDLDNFRPILARHIGRLKAQRVVYTEIMLGGSEVPRDPGEAVEKLGTFREWVNGLEEGLLQVEFILCFARKAPPERIAGLEARNLRLREAGLIYGVAVAGPEAGHPIRPHAETLSRLRDGGYGIEIHAGEWCGPESVWEALRYGAPDRLGHGVSLFQDPALVEKVQERQIHLELCPTSNVKTGSVTRLVEHPIARARELGLSFSVNTDDPGPFQNSMASEYELLERVFGFRPEDFERLYDTSLAARFQPELRGPAAGGTR